MTKNSHKFSWAIQGLMLHSSILHMDLTLPQRLDKIDFSSYRVVLFDIDGVLTAHGKVGFSAETISMIHMLLTSGIHVYFFSNNLFPERIAWLQEHLPQATILQNVLPKPHPEGILRALREVHFQKNEFLLCDDRLLTGGIAAAAAGIRFAWIAPAVSDFKNNFWQEAKFLALRKLDVCLVKLVYWGKKMVGRK